MPIEIKELHIRVNVNPPVSGQEEGGPAIMPENDTGFSGGAKLEIIAECVERVLEILGSKKDR